MNKVIWLKTARVYSTDSDMTAKVERITVKLEDGDNFNKFLKYIPLKGYKKDEQPYIEKVMEKVNGQWANIDPKKWVDQLNDVLKAIPAPDFKIDFKGLSEKQANELKDTKAALSELSERLRVLETKKNEVIITPGKDLSEAKPTAIIPTEKEIRTGLFVKATELGLKPPKNISTKKLQELIK